MSARNRPRRVRRWARVGLDRHAGGLRLAVLGRRQRGAKLDIHALVDIAATGDELVRLAREAIESLKLEGQHAVIGLAESEIEWMPLALPEMPERDLALAAQVQIRRALGERVDEMATEFLPCPGRRVAEGQVALHGLTVRRDHMDGVCDLARDIGLQPMVVDLRTMGIRRLIALTHPVEEGAVSVIAEVSGDTACLTFLRDGVPLFSRRVPLEVASPASHMAYMPSGDGTPTPDTEAGGDCASRSEALIAELRRSLDYGEFTVREREITALHLCGEGAVADGFAAAVADHAPCDTHTLDVESAGPVACDPSLRGVAPATAFAAAVGLALREDLL